MKTCNNCHTALPDDMATCPVCGAKVNDDAAGKANAKETPEKKSRLPLIAGILAAVILVAGIVTAVVLSGRTSDLPANETEIEAETETENGTEASENASTAETGHHINAYGYPSYSIHFEQDESGSFIYNYMDENGQLQTVDPAEAEALMDQIVATCGDMSLTNRDLMYYYDQQYYMLYSSYGAYMAYFMDGSLALDEQPNMEGTGTWQSYFLNASLNNFQQVAALYQDAMANGFVLSEADQAVVDGLEADMEDFAASNNYESAQAYLAQLYGPTATLESYVEYYRVYQTALAYFQSLADAIDCTDQALSDYFDANADAIYQNYHVEKIDKNVVNVRHILIQPEDTESDESWAEAEAEAQRIYEEWQNGEATEDSFADLANTYSADPGSSTAGGLYEGVYPGQMVTEFNDWCFDDARQTGDSAIVRTDYGYHIMYFSAEGDSVYWRTLAESLYKNEQATAIRDSIAASYEGSSDLSKAVILDYMTPSVPAADNTDEAETGNETE